jgi:hypothetical protein
MSSLYPVLLVIAPIWGQQPMEVQIIPLRELYPNKIQDWKRLPPEQRSASEQIEALGGGILMHYGNEGRQIDLITYKGRQFTDDHVPLLRAFSANPPYSVGFVNTKLSNEGIAGALACFQSLKSVHVSEMPIGDSALHTLEKFVDLEQLTLSETLATSAVLQHVAGHKPLWNLDVARTMVDNSGLNHLSGHANLKWLNVGKTQVTSACLPAIGTLARLESLTLHDTNVSDEEFIHIANLQNLTSLQLSGTRITNAAMSHVAKLTALKDLDIEGTAVDEKGLALLKDMPHLRVVRWVDSEKATPDQRRFFAKFILYLPGNMDRWKEIRGQLDRGEITIDQLITPP